MTVKIDERKIFELAQKLQAAEKAGGMFPLTFVEAQRAMGYSEKSKSGATYYLPLMEERGYVRSKILTSDRTKASIKKRAVKRQYLTNEPLVFNPITQPELKLETQEEYAPK